MIVFECAKGHTLDARQAKSVTCPECLKLYVRIRKQEVPTLTKEQLRRLAQPGKDIPAKRRI